jgi:hypothetical protein
MSNKSSYQSKLPLQSLKSWQWFRQRTVRWMGSDVVEEPGASIFRTEEWKLKQKVRPKSWYSFTKLHDVTFKKTVASIFTVSRTWDVTNARRLSSRCASCCVFQYVRVIVLPSPQEETHILAELYLLFPNAFSAILHNPLIPILSQLNPVYTYSFKTRFNIIHPFNQAVPSLQIF